MRFFNNCHSAATIDNVKIIITYLKSAPTAHQKIVGTNKPSSSKHLPTFVRYHKKDTMLPSIKNTCILAMIAHIFLISVHIMYNIKFNKLTGDPENPTQVG